MTFHYALCKDEGGIFVASVPALPGCATQAQTEAEADRKIQDAIRLYVAQMKEREIAIPEFVALKEVEIV